MENDTIAVLMTAYNERIEWFTEAVESILNQTYSNIRLYILLDNPDNVPLKNCIMDFASKDNRIIPIFNEVNLGLVDSLNKLIEMSEEKIIARMDSDDISLLDRFQKEYQAICTEGYDFVLTGCNLLDEDGKMTKGSQYPDIEGDAFARCMRYGNFSVHPTWMAKAEVFKRLEGYRQVRYVEDLDFVIRAIQSGYRIKRLSECLLNYRIRSSGISKTYAHEQYLKAEALTNMYITEVNLSDLDAVYLDTIGQNCSESKNHRFLMVIYRVEMIVKAFYSHDFIKCLGYSIGGMFYGPLFWKVFWRYVVNRIKVMLILK